jgi:mannose-1-phosphate guanylyltransferase/mannose-6-phosphate isomerase
MRDVSKSYVPAAKFFPYGRFNELLIHAISVTAYRGIGLKEDSLTSQNASQPGIYPVVLSGGSGTRLWPLSSAAMPKQFLSIVTEQSMMQDTLQRIEGVENARGPIVVCGAGHADIVRDQIAALGLTPSAILLEPEGRNTAAAVAIAAEWIAARDPDALMLVMPSDHVIADAPSLHQALYRARAAAQTDHLVTFGIQPSHAETGYGYIAKGNALETADGVHKVKEFVEKPNLALAQSYVDSGNYYWNGGIFLFKAGAYLAALKTHAPDIARASASAMRDAATDGAIVRPDRDAFIQSPNISIDVAVMEKATHVAVVPVDMGWSDVGSWDALWAIRAQDDKRNAFRGDVIDIDSSGNLVYIDGGPPVAAIGVSDSVIISTANGVLVMPLSRAQDVKAVVDRIKAKAG